MIHKTNVSNVYNVIAKQYIQDTNITEHIDEFLELLPKLWIVLDWWCWWGIDSNYMTLKEFNVIGVDISKEMINIAKDKFPTIDFRINDFKSLSFEDNTFDWILLSYSLIHTPKKDIVNILKKFRRILKKWWIMFIAVQSWKSEEVYIDAPYKPEEKIFINVYSENEIIEILEKNNFSVLKKYTRKPKNNELNFTKLYLILKKI